MQQWGNGAGAQDGGIGICDKGGSLFSPFESVLFHDCLKVSIYGFLGLQEREDVMWEGLKALHGSFSFRKDAAASRIVTYTLALHAQDGHVGRSNDIVAIVASRSTGR